MLQHLKLLKYLRAINLSPKDTLALMRRLETDSCRTEDYEVLIKVVRAHTELSSDLLEELPATGSSSPGRQKSRKPADSQRVRHRHHR